MSDNADLLDMDTLDDLRTMLDDGLEELLEEYLLDSARTLEALQEAAQRGDRAELVDLAHSLKGSSGNLGIQAVYRLSEQLEQDARSGALDDPAGRVEALAQVYQQTREALASLRHS
ncbi:MAG: Hpt domain-containing protein [Pseudomonadota bacterium]